MNVTASMALKLIPETLRAQPVFLGIDDTMVPRYGKKFEDVPKLFGHSVHHGSGCLNGHCFGSVLLCVPVWDKDRIVYQALPLSYRMWQKKESKLELSASMVRQVMPELAEKKNVILLCGSRYTKGDLVSVVDEYQNLGLTGNARYDSVLYDLAQQPTGKGAGLQNMEDAFRWKGILHFRAKKYAVTILGHAVSPQIFLAQGKSLPM